MSMERSGGDEDSDNMELRKIEYIWIELVVILDVGFSRYQWQLLILGFQLFV